MHTINNMSKLPVQYYRKLKQEPKVWIPDLQISAKLCFQCFENNAFAAITQEGVYPDGTHSYFGYLHRMSLRAEYEHINTTEIEFYDDCFADDKKYTFKEVENIQHPITYMEFPYVCAQNRDLHKEIGKYAGVANISVNGIEYEWCGMETREPHCYNCELFLEDKCNAPKCLGSVGFWKKI